MTLDELKVDSYSANVSENELTEIKGGTGWYCTAAEIAAAALIAVLTSEDEEGSGDSPQTPDTPTPPAT